MECVKVAILEDEFTESKRLCSYLETYGNQNGLIFETEVYSDPIKFLNSHKPIFDIIFMDIKMPGMDGLTAAKRLREFDEKAVLIFVTNLGNLAIKGYEVQALDFILKPITYNGFAMRIRRAVSQFKSRTKNYIMIPLAYGTMRIAVSDIFFVEVTGHNLSFNTNKGVINTRSKLSDFELLLAEFDFIRCNKSAIVNVKHIEKIADGNITVNGAILQLSRSRRKEFVNNFKRMTDGRVFSFDDVIAEDPSA